jgi:hypothetical protein
MRNPRYRTTVSAFVHGDRPILMRVDKPGMPERRRSEERGKERSHSHPRACNTSSRGHGDKGRK